MIPFLDGTKPSLYSAAMSQSFLEMIKPQVAAEVERLKQEMSPQEWRDRALRRSVKSDFCDAIKDRGGIHVIAEIKKASPSRGILRDSFDPVALARIYEAHGAAALSVLTEEKYFLGSVRHLAQVAMISKLPVLRKDFILDEIQIAQARSNGAAAVLLILSFLARNRLEELIRVCEIYSMTPLVEVHDAEELEQVTSAGAKLIGVNNRNLKTLEVDVEISERLIDLKTDGQLFVAESGLNSPDQVVRLHERGYDAFLIGEHFMKSADPGAELDRMRGRQ
ncbi:MAG: indole-3-glycerol phosphate synthase TrpC [Acidobacteriia bacterium]|nr:indole-3-glycerol phosphate synthase TrpC [Terriglobia bacterium]